MASTRRRSSTGFSSPEEEIEEVVEETSAEVVEEIVEEEEEVVEEVKPVATAPTLAPILNNPKPVVKRDTPRRNTPRFSAQR